MSNVEIVKAPTLEDIKRQLKEAFHAAANSIYLHNQMAAKIGKAGYIIPAIEQYQKLGDDHPNKVFLEDLLAAFALNICATETYKPEGLPVHEGISHAKGFETAVAITRAIAGYRDSKFYVRDTLDSKRDGEFASTEAAIHFLNELRQVAIDAYIKKAESLPVLQHG